MRPLRAPRAARRSTRESRHSCRPVAGASNARLSAVVEEHVEPRNVLNLTVMVGNRLGGLSGAAVSVIGYLGWPILVVVGMGIFYQHYGSLPQVQQALSGMSKVGG